MSVGPKQRKGKKTRDLKRNAEPIYQDCCGAPKNGHYGDCKRKGK